MAYTVEFRGPARRALSETLPEAIASAAYAFCIGALAGTSHRVGRQLHPPLDGYHGARRGTYLVVYKIHDRRQLVTVDWIGHRSDVYRPR